MTRVVLDASVAVKWFVLEGGPGERAAGEVQGAIIRGAVQAIVPELFFFEALSVLSRRLPGEGAAASALESLATLVVERAPLDLEIGRRAEVLVRAYGLSGYDASYAALAEIHRCPWWTFDRRAHERIASLGVSRLLG